MISPSESDRADSDERPTADVPSALLDDLLEKTSRTFALSIPVLPEPTRREVTVAYLLFRIADTLEDAVLWARPRQLRELAAFAQLLEMPTVEEARVLAARWADDPPVRHDGYVELLAETPTVIQATLDLSGEARDLVTAHTVRTIHGMSSFLEEDPERAIELRTIEDLQAYCYAVAGIVGELLTELFLLGRDDLEPAADDLRRDAARFGEALQLVNICKDSATDAREGRRYLPADVDPGDVLRMALDDLDIAGGYCLRLNEVGAPRGIIAFTALPVLLAWGTLEVVQRKGAGAKMSRPAVREIVRRLDRALDRGEFAAFWSDVRKRVARRSR